MQINIDRNNERTVRLTKSEIKTLQKAEILLDNLVGIEGPATAKALEDLELHGLASLIDGLPIDEDENSQEAESESPNEDG